MCDIAIKVENLSKLYQLGTIGTGTLRNDLQRWWSNIRGAEDPFAKIGTLNDRTKKAESEFVWALKDINFEIKKGEVLGIIGRNGAGKSTLLKILSKITAPTSGKIMVNGRIASLLEVGTGFHPELTGRENIFMNGAILGMRKWEIQKKLDEIIDFSGVTAYIDTPVKRYSSGMYVRLAFAVAAFLEPEVLIVDEVLAVGDADFQKKCLGRMKDVSINDGRTVLFVSHNMGAVKQLSNSIVVIQNGKLIYNGNTQDGISLYSNYKGINSGLIYDVTKYKRNWNGSNEIKFEKLFFENTNLFDFGSDLFFKAEVRAFQSIKSFRFSLTVFAIDGTPVGSCFGSAKNEILKGENLIFKISVPGHRLAIGKYFIGISVGYGNNEVGHSDFDVVTDVLHFEVIPQKRNGAIGIWAEGWGKIVFNTLITEKL